MQIKINEELLEEYSEKFANTICEQFFQEHAFISGKEILEITPSKQVNFFIIKLLFSNWQQESQRLESPFFDYQAQEVKKAMLTFMNVLSQHIKVARKEFSVLLEDAVRDTLHLLLNPSIYLDIELDRRGEDELSEKCVRNIMKYLRLDKEAFGAFLQEQTGTDREDLEVNIDVFNQELVNSELAKLSEIAPISWEDLEETEEPEVQEPKAKKEPEEEKTPFSIDEDDLIAPRVARASIRRESRVEEVDDDDLEEPEDVPLPAAPKSAPAETTDAPKETLPPPSTIDPKQVITNMDDDDEVDEEVEDETFNDTFQGNQGPTLADTNSPINNILEAVSINQRYMFINELYDGDADVFLQSLKEVDGLDSFDTSVDHLVKNYAAEYDWDMNSDEVKELLKIVFRRFR